MHVIIGDSRGRLGAVERVPLHFLQPRPGGEKLRLDLRAQILRAVARFTGGALHQILSLRQHFGKIVDEFFTCCAHDLLQRKEGAERIATGASVAEIPNRDSL